MEITLRQIIEEIFPDEEIYENEHGMMAIKVKDNWRHFLFGPTGISIMYSVLDPEEVMTMASVFRMSEKISLKNPRSFELIREAAYKDIDPMGEMLDRRKREENDGLDTGHHNPPNVITDSFIE